MSVAIEEVIAAIPEWRGRRITTEEIVGGLTNRNFRVDVDGQPCFVRIPGADTALLAVDRGNELANSRAAAEAGVGPRVLEHLPAWDVMVLEWLPGRTLSNETCLEPGMPERIASALRQLHAGPRFRDDFDMAKLSARYLAVVDERRIRIPTAIGRTSPSCPGSRRRLRRGP